MSVHRLELRSIDHELAFLCVLDETGVNQFFQMEGQRRGCHTQRFADPARADAVRAGLDQQAEDRQSGILGKCSERCYGGFILHRSNCRGTGAVGASQVLSNSTILIGSWFRRSLPQRLRFGVLWRQRFRQGGTQCVSW